MGKVELRPYQKQILKELKNVASIGLLMGTGTGKTITSMFRVKDNPTKNLLIICPHNVLSQWKDVINSNFSDFLVLEFKKTWGAEKKNDEIEKFLLDKTDNSVNSVQKTIIVNFEILHKLDSLLTIDSSWTIIIDESHRIKDAEKKKYKNGNSYKLQMVKTTAMALKIGQLTPWKIILTATPTQGAYGGYIDFFSQLKFLGYIDYDLSEFKDRYCIIQQQMLWGKPYPIKKIVGYKNTNEIDNILKMCCRYYESRFGDFEPVHNKIMLEKPKSYNKLVRERAYGDIILNSVPRKRLAQKTITTGTVMGMDYYNEKLTYQDNTVKEDWLKDFLSDTNEVVAVYYQYNVELERLEKLMKKLKKRYIVINGKTKDPYKEINNKEYDVVLGQFQSASQSLDGLQHKCHIMVFYAMPESSLLYKQSLGRINRDGQKRVPMYYYLVVEKTIEDDIYDMIENKIEFSEETLDRLVIERGVV